MCLHVCVCVPTCAKEHVLELGVQVDRSGVHSNGLVQGVDYSLSHQVVLQVFTHRQVGHHRDLRGDGYR